MQKNRLGRTEIKVSKFCLGTMTWGTQTGARKAHAQIDMALDHGVNFIDTAELYPMDPVKSETIGRTERIIGLWLEGAPNRRSDIVIATKQVGQGMRMIRDGAPINAATIRLAVEGSLRRLKTDYIDLFQFHWPNRGSYHFRPSAWHTARPPAPQKIKANMVECLHALEAERRRGTIRAFGVSNETAWGVGKWLSLAESHDAPRPVSVQNEYSLLQRSYETDLAELSVNEDIGLLANSPLAAGLLTGKYQGNAVPKGSRMERTPSLNSRATARSFAAVEDYMDLAFKHDLDPVQMAMAWVTSRPFVTSAVFGTRTAEQLARVLEGADLTLSREFLDDVEIVRRDHPMPY
ncbi:aldo/keto reductase [Pseudooceanicola onchidii]|uniref:aldo/keto reductase n=1 Tax=Pseudooceanicola onchidii TaxID=2562279 RepID=UPI0010AA05C1|nr:aldo/keto reductase [Pseudooceanicola onchidii]